MLHTGTPPPTVEELKVIFDAHTNTDDDDTQVNEP